MLPKPGWILVVLILLVTVPLQATLAVSDPPSTETRTPNAGPRTPLGCEDGDQASGATYRICMPDSGPWNGDLVVYAHGYVSPTEPVGIPEDQMGLPGGPTISDVITQLGYGFAASGYSTNGLAVRQGLADLIDAVDIFAAAKGQPNRIFLIGVSEGGLIAVQGVERYPDVFDGGLALCGPYGDFRRQIDHIADVRVLFDYYFPGLMPGNPVDIPPALMDQWDEYYATNIQPAIQDPANAAKVSELLAVSGVAYDPADPQAREAVIEKLLWYNVFGTNDAIDKLGGQPFDNQDRVYSGSADDEQLNQAVDRYSADQVALDELGAHYQTSGQLTVPLVTLHTLGDHLVPYWQALGHRGRVISADNIALHELQTVDRYGHCTFTAFEVLGAFNRLSAMVADPPPYQPVQRLLLPLALRSN
jgi:pimeloyl-ACP methyl ester carboxylesterase